MSQMCMSCKSQLDLDQLCVKCVNAGCIKVQQAIADDICTQTAEVKSLSVESETANNICVSGTLSASNVKSLNSNTNFLCATNATLNNACISNLTVGGNLSYNVHWRAAVTYSANVTYPLGDPLNWNVILDDPNNSVKLAPFTYTVPASGYYIVTMHMYVDSLTGSSTISGTPLGVLLIQVNGNELESDYAPFLDFSTSQKATLTSLCLLNKGDVITMNYNVLVLNSSSGLVPYVGTVNIEANGTYPGESGFVIHYLSSLNSVTQPTCAACPTVTIPCTPFKTPCSPISNNPPVQGACSYC